MLLYSTSFCFFFSSLQPTTDAATASSSSSTTDLLLGCILEFFFAMNKIETTVSHFAVGVSLLTKFVIRSLHSIFMLVSVKISIPIEN